MRTLSHIARDLRQAMRLFGRAPVLAAVIIVSVGAGIGVNTIVFAWVQARLFHPLPAVPDSASLQLIEPRLDAGGYPGASWLEYLDLAERLQSFESVIAFRMAPLYVGEAGRIERTYGQLVSGNYFPALGVRPALGRLITPADTLTDEPVAVISHGLWQSRFAGSPDAVGRAVRVNGRDLTVVGVTAREFQGTVMALSFDLWIPATLAPAVLGRSRELTDRGIRGYALIGRLAPGVSRQQAQAELDGAMRELALTYPATNDTVRGEVLAFSQAPRGPQRMMVAALVTLQALMLLLLLTVCGNTTNLVLARASARQREIGVRLALGAGLWQIVTLLLAETVLLALLGAVLGAAIAVAGTDALVTLPLSGLPVRFQTAVDGATVAFAAGLGLLSGLLVGAAPAVHLARLDPQLAIRSGARNAGRNGLRQAVMGIQAGLAVIVLIAAGLSLHSFRETRATDPGFRRDGILLAGFDLSGRDASAASSRAFAARLLDELGAVPDIAAAAISSSVPLDIHGLPSREFTLEGRARADGTRDAALSNIVTPGYFALMDIPLRSGRDFADLTDGVMPAQAIVNEAFVRRYSEGLEPLGRRLEVRGRAFVITGVAVDSLYDAFGEPPTPAIYLSYRDNPLPYGEIHVRGRVGREVSLAAPVRRAVQTVDSELPVFNVRTLTDHVETNLVFRRVPARIFSVLGPMLLALAAIGIYAVVAYTVSLRTNEIGIRLALGATTRRLIAQFVGESLGVIALGALVGWAAALVLAMAVLGDAGIEPVVFAVVPAVLLTVAALAAWLPARRAAHVNPMMALRDS